jgi:glycosyltransferase involved in cell wall biosynthesis
LNIGVNSRYILERGTGVPNYVAYLYRKLLEVDATNEYTFLQTSDRKTLGRTLVAPSRPGIAGAAQFDCLKVRSLIREAKAQIYHATAHILPLQRTPGVKYVVTFHDLGTRVLPQQYGWQHKLYYRLLVPRSLKLADAVIADSHNTKRDILRFYGTPESKVHVVHLGVGDQFIGGANQPGDRLIPEKYFFSITTHPKRKNVLGALRAFATFADKTPLKYVIAGLIDDAQRQEVVDLAASLGLSGRVQLFGYADDQQLINLYRHAEFLIYPSFYEGFGFPVVEAMSCGCPVITSNTSSLPELMLTDEWLVNPADIGDIAAKMQRMMGLPQAQRAELIAKNLQHARTFTWEKAAKEMMAVFAKVGGTSH